ncbi:MAG: N-acetyltransferase [Chloroflexi bacterium]|jgi:GNAT superfamily N-acetyltransferase|nr:N-acetyltransferase [Chloroflexota bacterium]
MDRKTILALYDKEQRIDIEYPDLHKEVTGDVVRFMGPAERHSSNFVLYGRLTAENADDVIGEQIAFFGRYGFPFEWKVYDHDTPSDLRARLLMHGFKARERDAIMVLDIHAASPILLQPVEADVRRLTDAQEVKRLITLLEEVWQMDFTSLGELLQEDLWKRPSYSSIYMAYVDDQPACAGWVQFTENSQFASLWGGTTLPQFRGQGLYTAVMAARVQEASRRGYSFLTIDASRMSRPIAEKYGFQLLTYAHACMWHPE